MGIALLQAIETTKDRLPDYVKRAVSQHMPRIADNFEQIMGVRHKPKYFYREGDSTEELRTTTIERFSGLYFSIATANRAGGHLIESAFESCVAVVDRFLLSKRTRDFWEIEESISSNMVELRRAKITGDFLALVAVVNKLEADMKELRAAVAVGVSMVN